MFNYLELKEKTLLITKDELKNKIIEEIMSYKTLLNIKVMSISEVKNRLFFESTPKAFSEVYYKYNLPLSIINKIINYLYYIDINKEYNNEKINKLKHIKIHLLNNNLLKTDSRFSKILKDYKIKLLGFNTLTKEDDFLINELKKYNDIEILNNSLNSYTPKLIHLDTIEDEIIYVAETISNLLSNNIDINNIKLCNINDEYLFYLKRIFNNYNLSINLNEKISLFSLPLSNIFINLLKENSKDETINILKDTYPNNIEYINQYINILNKYSYLDNIDFDLITYELKNTYIKQKKKSNSINIIALEEIYDSNDYIFVMSCNYNYFPKIVKDEDYLLDKEKDILNLSTSKDINKYNITSILNLITSSKNIYLTYKDKSYFNEYHKVDFLNLDEKNYTKDIKVSYSKNEDKIQLIKNLDHNKKDNITNILYNNYPLEYLSYDSSFKGINEDTFNLSLLSQNFNLSYSNLNTYYECPFKFYISNVLKLNPFNDSIYTIIGKVMHDVIESCFKDDFDFEVLFETSKEKHLKDYDYKESELFFLNNVKSRTLDVVNYLKEHEEYTLLNKHLYEKKIKFNKVYNNHKVTIKGFIDKLIYCVIDNILYCAIIDLKTGKDKIDQTKFEFGLNLQLPFYIYLLRNDSEFKDANILGLYIHNILNDENNNTTLKYNGLTNNNLDTLSILDKTYVSSLLIKGLKLTSDGNFSKNAKLTSDEEINYLYTLVESKIEEMIENVYNKNFKINPKIINNKEDVSCSYCKYSSICYKNIKDYTYLEVKKEDDENA